MGEPAKSFCFGPFQFDMEQRLLLREGKPVSLAPKAISILSVLLENHGKLVERDDLMNRVWPNLFVEEGNLTVNIFALRKILDAGCAGGPTIETIPRRGYRFVVPVIESSGVGSRELGVGVEPTQLDSSPSERNGNDKGRAAAGGETTLGAGAAEAPHTSVIPAKAVIQGAYPAASSISNWLFAVAGIAVVAAVLLLWMLATPPAAPKVSHVVQLTHFGSASAVATDGARLYVAEEKGGVSSIALVPLEGGDPVPIPTPFRNTWLLDVSPSRSELLVASLSVRGDPKLVWTLPLLGGSPRRLGDVVSDSAKWSPDGSKIAFQSDGHIDVVNSEGSDLRKLADEGSGVESWSPDARLIRFTRVNGATGGMSMWEVQSDGTHLRPFLPERQNPNARWGEGQCCGRWTPDGRYFLFREAFGPRVGIWELPEKRGILQFRRQQPVEIYAAGFDLESPTIAPDGRHIFVVGRAETGELVRYDRTSRQFVPLLSDLPADGLKWSPDRQWIVYTTLDHSLWKAKSDGSARLQLTFPPMQAFGAVWSPDGNRLSFHSLSPGQPGKICLIPADGGKVETLFAQEPTGENVANWSPDGNTLMFQRTWLDKEGNTTRSAICMLDLITNRVSELPGSENMGPPAWAPDGRYVAAQSGDFRQLMLFDFRSQHWTVIARAGFVNAPQWSHDSRFVIYQDTAAPEGQPIYRVSVPEGRVEEIASRKQLLRGDVSAYRLVSVDPSDEPVAVVVRRNADVYALDLSPPE